jgi:predicted Zn finger-like uncharacterized protein
LKIICPRCEATYNLDSLKIKVDISKLKCTKCDFSFVVTSDDVIDDLPEKKEVPLKNSSSVQTKIETSSEPKEDDKWIVEAIRLAEVIVSDIHIYNKDKVTNCKTDEELVLTLGAELKRGRKFYMEKINPKLINPNKYYAEAVRKFLRIKNK